MKKRWNLEMSGCENGYTVTYWLEGNAATYIASTPAKVMKIVKAILKSNQEEKQNAD